MFLFSPYVPSRVTFRAWHRSTPNAPAIRTNWPNEYWTLRRVRRGTHNPLATPNPLWHRLSVESEVLRGAALEPTSSAQSGVPKSPVRPPQNAGGKVTTEIAVANQLGIALAADSAVTITGGGHTKVFDTADKLFELSGAFPVAVMINGNMNCLGTPWEILIKNFRSSEGATARGSIEKWARDFLAYVENHDPGAEETEGGYIDRVIRAEIAAVQESTMAVVAEFVYQASRGSDHVLTRGDLDIRKVLAAAVRLRGEALDQYAVVPALAEIGKDALQGKYGERINAALDAAFQKATDEEKASIKLLIIEALMRATDSDAAAGIAVAGYGTDDMFPAIFSAEIDGRVSGKLKIYKEKYATIASCADGGMVTSFAQTDVIERLLRGVDPRFVTRSGSFIERAVKDAMQKGFEASDKKKPSKKVLAEREKLATEMAEAARGEYQDKAAGKIKENFAREFDGMIAMMPKQELIELAEALVSITAIERKATVDEGTVGGPVDVALITKHEGFVWIKRKHHFPRDLNPRYFYRKFGTAP